MDAPNTQSAHTRAQQRRRARVVDVSTGATVAGGSPLSQPAVQAGLCLLALGILRRLNLAKHLCAVEVVRALGVARSTAYLHEARLRAQLEDDEDGGAGVNKAAAPAHDPETQRLRIENAVLRYRLEHPGCWNDGGRTVYSDDLHAFVLALSLREEVGERLTQEEFAQACDIPLATLKPWWAAQRATVTSAATAKAAPTAAAVRASESADTVGSAEAPAGSTAGVVEEPALSGAPPPSATHGGSAERQRVGQATLKSDHRAAGDRLDAPRADLSPTTGFTLEMLRIVKEWETWRGSFDAFVREHLQTLGIHHGKKLVSDLLHLAAARRLVRRPPPRPPARGSTLVPPPGVQWSSDGKEVVVVVGREPFTVAWQPMVDIGSTATVGSIVRPAEDAAGVIASFREGVMATGAPATALLLDNKAPNKSVALLDALPNSTFVMYGTPGRGQSKATIEGGFGLFAQDLGPVAAVVDTASPERMALSVADAVTRAYSCGRNHRPRREDGKTPFELYRDANPSPEEIAAAVAKLRAIKERIEARERSEAARRDPHVRATLEDACVRFGLVGDGDILDSLSKLPLAVVQEAVAIYAAKRTASSLPAGAGLRYLAGIARNCQYVRELQLFEEELVSLLEREQPSVMAHLERRAAALESLDLAPRLDAIVHELLTVLAPVAQVFWRRAFATAAENVPSALRDPLRRRLCARIRRRFRVTKQHRQQLITLTTRLLRPEQSPAASPVR